MAGGCQRPRPHVGPGFVVWDGVLRKPYVWTSWSSIAQAEAERRSLLRCHPADSLWHTRLTVAWFRGGCVPGSGYRRKPYSVGVTGSAAAATSDG